MDKEQRIEEIAKLGYQYAFLIDDKNIDEWWRRADKKERWYDFAHQINASFQGRIPQGDDEGLLTEEELTKLEIDFNRNVYGVIDFSKLVAKAQRDLTTRLIKQDEKCSYCDGVGVVPTGQSNEIICPKCNGSRRQPKFDEEEIRTEATKYYAEKMAEAIERLRIKKDAEHQQKIDEIFEEMEKHERIGLEFNALPNHIHFTMPKDIWSALKSSFLKEGWGGQ